jgi:hypothetical protein
MTPSPAVTNGSVTEIVSSSPSSTPTSTPTPSPASGGGEKTIVRNADTTEEKMALAAAEAFNASEAFNRAPFTWNSYAYANFIDSEVINYYNNSYERSKETAQNVIFSYDANVYAWNQTRAVYDRTSKSIRVSSPNGTIQFPSQRGWGTQIQNAYLNYSRYQEINLDEIDFSFSNCYVVEMRLRYSQVLGPTAGFMSDVYQIVIMNEDFKPILLCAQSQQGIS